VNTDEQSLVAHVAAQVDAGKPTNLRSMNLNGASLAKRFNIVFPLTDEVMTALNETLGGRAFTATQDAIGLIVRHT
jgi:hypothetical protein